MRLCHGCISDVAISIVFFRGMRTSQRGPRPHERGRHLSCHRALSSVKPSHSFPLPLFPPFLSSLSHSPSSSLSSRLSFPLRAFFLCPTPTAPSSSTPSVTLSLPHPLPLPREWHSQSPTPFRIFSTAGLLAISFPRGETSRRLHPHHSNTETQWPLPIRPRHSCATAKRGTPPQTQTTFTARPLGRRAPA